MISGILDSKDFDLSGFQHSWQQHSDCLLGLCTMWQKPKKSKDPYHTLSITYNNGDWKICVTEEGIRGFRNSYPKHLRK